MALTLVALFDDKARYPTVPPEFAQHVGWMVFAFALAMLAWTWTRAESVRRSILALEDPRTFAVLRIGFAIMTIANFLNLAPYWRMLFSDEGMFDLVYAQDRMGRTALRGWTPDDGFFDVWAIANFLWNKPSLFYMYGSPQFVVFHMLLLFGVCTLYGCGVASRTTGVLAWLLMSSVYNRNSLYWEGTDTVYRAFWLFMLFAKTGHAWSFDNWLRCRRLRARGQLEDPEADAEANRGKQPIYRLIPSWPRYLFLLQLAALYCATGTVKTGDVWAKGDSLYYALNMDHFYRFEGITQAVSSVFATNVFRLNTWVTHWWEMCFPLLIVGEVLRFGGKHRDEPWYRAQHRGWRLWLGRLALVVAYALLYRTLYEILPYCVKMVEDAPKDTTPHLRRLHILFGGVLPALMVVWFVLGRWPIRLIRGGRSLGKLTTRWPWLRIPEIHIEQQSLRRWLLGRRVWLTLGFVFHGFLIAFMNIGMFPFIMLMQYAAFYSGEEYVRVFGRASAWLRRHRRLAWLAAPARVFVPAQSPASVPVRGRRFPDLLVLLLGFVAVYLVYAKATKEPWIGPATKYWLGAILLVAIAMRLLRPRAREVAAAREPGPAPAYSAIGRALALFAFCWHVGAVGLHLFPPFPVFNGWRSPAKSMFGSWLSGTGTAQSWEMFAPNPPRSNTFMKTVVVEADGDRWNLANNAYDFRPNPWIINDRMRKMQRRMVGKGKWYLRYWASYHCRDWAIRTGEVPEEIEIWSISTRIPSPEVVNIWQPSKFKGRKDVSGALTGRPYDPRALKVKETLVQTHACGKDGQLPPYMKERYGVELTEADVAAQEKEADRLERQYSTRESTWENRSDWGRGGDSPEERRARTEKLRRDRQAEQLEDRIDDAQNESPNETPIENAGDDERGGDEGE